jgi:hypothetical protein
MKVVREAPISLHFSMFLLLVPYSRTDTRSSQHKPAQDISELKLQSSAFLCFYLLAREMQEIRNDYRLIPGNPLTIGGLC